MKEKNKRSIRKEIQFSEEEFSAIRVKSNAAGLSPAVFIREAALIKNISAALSQEELGMIRRVQSVSTRMQSNLNQIARLANTHGFIPLFECIVKLIMNIDTYFRTGGEWSDIEIPQNIKQLEDILKEANEKYQKIKEAALNLYYYTHEGEKYFKEKYKCSIYTNTSNTKFFLRVETSEKSHIEIPEQLFKDYINRKASIKDIYDYWARQ